MSASRKGSTRHHRHHRHRHGHHFVSIELGIVLLVVLIVLLIAVPSYYGVMGRAHSTAARSNVTSATQAVEAYFLLHDSTYVGLDLHWLQEYDPGVKLDDPAATPWKQTATTYCVSATVGGKTWYKAGPGAPVTTTAC